MALVALAIGLLTAGAVAVGYDLTKVVHQLFQDHVYHPKRAQGSRTGP